MIDNQLNQRKFGDRLTKLMKENKYSIRFYADMLNIPHSTLAGLMKKDTALISNVRKMVQSDYRLLPFVEDYFPKKSKIKLRTPPSFSEDRETVKLQKEIIRLNEVIIQYQNIIKNENCNTI